MVKQSERSGVRDQRDRVNGDSARATRNALALIPRVYRYIAVTMVFRHIKEDVRGSLYSPQDLACVLIARIPSIIVNERAKHLRDVMVFVHLSAAVSALDRFLIHSRRQIKTYRYTTGLISLCFFH